jgi:hypothetical protein
MNLAQPLATHVPMTEDEVRRIRMRYYKALAAGMSGPEAAAYAQGQDLAEPSVFGGHDQVELTAAPPATDCSDAALSPKLGFWALPDNTGHHQKINADRLVLHQIAWSSKRC